MPKLSITDKKMLQLIPILKDRGDIRFAKEFADAIKMPKQNIRNVKEGIQHFTAMHIQRACKEFNVNANWIMNLSDQVSRVTAEIKFISEGSRVNKKVNKVKRKTAK